MELNLIYDGIATLEDLYRLNQIGYEFEINNGKVTGIYHVDR